MGNDSNLFSKDLILITSVLCFARQDRAALQELKRNPARLSALAYEDPITSGSPTSRELTETIVCR
jgi:hypothetical protein